jgi:PAS domain S-box-containing protein
MKKQIFIGFFSVILLLGVFGYFSVTKMMELSDVANSIQAGVYKTELFSTFVKLQEEFVLLTILTLVFIVIVIVGVGVYVLRNISSMQSEANLQMSLATDAAGIGVWDYNLKTGKLLWDDWMLKLYGIERSDFNEDVSTWIESLHSEDKEHTIKILENAIKGENEYDVAFRIVRPDGEIRHIDGHAIILRDDAGEPLRMIGANYDITTLMENKEALRQRDIMMLQQSRLAQMGEMISMIAHQWRQPLAAISATVINIKLQFELDSDELLDEKNQKKFISNSISSLDDISTFVSNLTTTIDDFRTFYKPDKLPALILIDKPIRKALHIIQSSLKSDNVEIEIVCRDTKKVKIFENEMIQVFLNILKNAQDNFKERETKSAKITIECKDVASQTVISICDNGGGIPKDVMPYIFEPYYSTKDEKNGTGLGLYMSKQIIEHHHHGILLVENVDDGCCFTIKLPLERD